jgi:alcohol dehydrogenase
MEASMILFYRIYQLALKLFSPLLAWREPLVLQGLGSIKSLEKEILKTNVRKFLLLTDQGIVQSKLLDYLLNHIDQNLIHIHVFDQVKPNPTKKLIESAYQVYKDNQLEGLIGFGGGSSIDLAKAIGVRIVKPKRNLNSLKGILKVNKKIPLLIAIPTTQGTGSEVTVATVITDEITHEKFAISDLNLIPRIAVLDPNLTINLPQFYSATTGMDALTHAIESYLNLFASKESKKRSLNAISLIFDNILKTYEDPKDLVAREKMLKASYDAGYAFTRSYVGYIHGIAHQFGGFYDVPHGYANAIIMPYVLIAYGKKIHQKLATLLDLVSPNNHLKTYEEKSNHFIELIIKLNQKMNIPSKISVPDLNNVKTMVNRAHQEVNPLYPVPKIFKKDDLELLFIEVSSIK